MSPNEEFRRQLEILEVPYDDLESESFTAGGNRVEWFTQAVDGKINLSIHGASPKRAALIVELFMRGR